jgi:phosphoribosylformylglycinamidine synthase I
MKYAVVVFPGSNCDEDMVYALSEVLGYPVEKVWHKETALPSGTDVVVLPGGFSYGDYLRTGAIARFSNIMKAVSAFAAAGGLVIGICNGFQILCEAGLLPGVLLRNHRQRFICRNTWIRAEQNTSFLTSHLEVGKPLCIPIAHAEGRYYADDQTLDALDSGGQVLFRYCNAEGNLTEESNPNGSARHIAGICNSGRNVFGMMPHPERAFGLDILGNQDGLGILRGVGGVGA